jgi:hypothetical protein
VFEGDALYIKMDLTSWFRCRTWTCEVALGSCLVVHIHKDTTRVS